MNRIAICLLLVTFSTGCALSRSSKSQKHRVLTPKKGTQAPTAIHTEQNVETSLFAQEEAAIPSSCDAVSDCKLFISHMALEAPRKNVKSLKVFVAKSQDLEAVPAILVQTTITTKRTEKTSPWKVIPMKKVSSVAGVYEIGLPVYTRHGRKSHKIHLMANGPMGDCHALFDTSEPLVLSYKDYAGAVKRGHKQLQRADFGFAKRVGSKRINPNGCNLKKVRYTH